MSTIEKIFNEAKMRCDLLRESIDRGLYDSPQPAKKLAFQEKLQQIIGEGQDQIKQYYKKKHGIKYRFKNKNTEVEKKNELFQMILGYENDLTNRLALLNYYIKNQINDPKKCRDMSQEKCGRAANISDCYWVPGSDELGEWAMRQNGKGIVINKPEYIGVGASQKPRGCYPIHKGENPEKLLSGRNRTRRTFINTNEFNTISNIAESKKTPGRDLTDKELKIMQLRGNNKPNNLTNAQIAESEINSSNTSKFTNAQLQHRRNRQSKKAKRKQEMNAVLERLKGMRKTRGSVASKMNNTRMGGGKKRKIKKRRKKKGGTRKNAMNESPIVDSLYYITIHYPASETVRAKVVGKYIGTGEEFYGMSKNDHLFMVENPPASLEYEKGPWLASSWKLNKRKNLMGGRKTRKKRGGKKKKRMTAKQYWKSGRFSGKTWWMPRSMKTASWFHDTLKYGIPI